MVKGSAGYVLPRFENKAYGVISEGDHFGHIDMASNKGLITVGRTGSKHSAYGLGLIRLFTVQAFCGSELMQLSINDLLSMKLEFPNHFTSMFTNAR